MSDLVGNPEDRFSRVTAHLICYAKNAGMLPLGCSFTLFLLKLHCALKTSVATMMHDVNSWKTHHYVQQ